MELDLRASGVDLAGDLHDLRGRQSDYADVHAENDHAASRRLAAALREDGSNGLVYDSVRRGGGQCAAVFRPGVLSRVRRTRSVFRLGWEAGGVGLREAVLAVVGAPGCSERLSSGVAPERLTGWRIVRPGPSVGGLMGVGHAWVTLSGGSGAGDHEGRPYIAIRIRLRSVGDGLVPSRLEFPPATARVQ